MQRTCITARADPSSYTRSQPAGEALLARAPRTVPSWAVCKMKDEGRSSNVQS